MKYFPHLAGWGPRLAAGWLLLVGLVGAVAPLLPLPYKAGRPDLQHLGMAPGAAAGHYLGTDPLGRDVLAGLVAGATQVLKVSFPATLLATLVGALLGGAAGFWGNSGLRLRWEGVAVLLGLLAWLIKPPLLLGVGVGIGSAVWLSRQRQGLPLALDSAVVGFSSLLGSVPKLLLLLAVLGGRTLGPAGLVGLLIVFAWPEAARLVRAQMLQVRGQPYIESARALGLGEGRIWWRHAMPAATTPLRSFAPLLLAALVGLETTLAFLGVDQNGSTPSWGVLLGQYAQDVSAWWLLVLPGGALLLTLLALQAVAKKK